MAATAAILSVANQLNTAGTRATGTSAAPFLDST
jgi:hypothetical protein